jgi:hypothetical protein
VARLQLMCTRNSLQNASNSSTSKQNSTSSSAIQWSRTRSKLEMWHHSSSCSRATASSRGLRSSTSNNAAHCKGPVDVGDVARLQLVCTRDGLQQRGEEKAAHAINMVQLYG